VLCAASDGKRIVTGGDDGKVVALDAKGETSVLATDAKRRWIDNVALHPEGAVAWSAGKTAFVRSGKGDEKSFDAPSTVGGLAFAPKGVRLAIAHYNGVTLWFPNAQTEPEKLEWKGSHLGALMSPDGKFVISSMQEPMLHGWRLADSKDMRMSGYGARVRSLGWTVGGKWLATSGSNQLILWPFQGKDGPMGKTPRILAPTEAQAEVVACHPKQEVVAVGYADGLVLLVRIDDGAEVLARKPAGTPVSALAWSATGSMLAVAAEDGDAGVVVLG
jgi:WD40 repeat protein